MRLTREVAIHASVDGTVTMFVTTSTGHPRLIVAGLDTARDSTTSMQRRRRDVVARDDVATSRHDTTSRRRGTRRRRDVVARDDVTTSWHEATSRRRGTRRRRDVVARDDVATERCAAQKTTSRRRDHSRGIASVLKPGTGGPRPLGYEPRCVPRSRAGAASRPSTHQRVSVNCSSTSHFLRPTSCHT
jgi:hypothetical protein